MTAEQWTEAAEGSSSEVGSGTSDDVVDLLSTLIRFDTTNWGRGRSAGERKAATWIADQLAAAGWSPLVLARDDAPERANVVLRVPGVDRDRPALLVHGHLDVVPAAPDDWSVEPFAGVGGRGRLRVGAWGGRHEGHVRGVPGDTAAMGPRRRATRARHRLRVPRRRGGRGAVRGRLACPRRARSLFAGVEAAIGESGGMFRWLRHGDRSARCYPVGTAERGSMHLRLTARGAAGHASRPGPTSAVTLLIDVLHRLAHHRWPMHLSPPVRPRLAGTAEALGLAVDLDTEAGVEACLELLGHAADVAKFTVRASTTPTMLDAGYKVNVIPGVATAEVDVRCPPGFADQLEATLPGLIGDTVEYEFTSHSLPISPRWTARGSRRSMLLFTGPTRRPWSSPTAWGVERTPRRSPGWGSPGTGSLPWARTRRDGSQGVHGVDERVPVASLRWGKRVLDDFLRHV